MRAELISVGTELLLGQITDTNAAFLARVLAEHGVDLYFKQTVGDNPARIQQAVRLALERADLVVMTGGLGPTEDDLTVAAVADLLGLPLVERPEAREHIRTFFETRRRPAPASVYKQALLPQGARLIPNRRGTAPGVAITHGQATIVILPGVPAEMEAMVEDFLLPWLRERTGGQVIRSRILRVTGLGESAVEERIKDLLAMTTPTVAPYAKLGEVHLRLTAKGTPEAVAAALDEGERLVRARLGDLVYGVDEETLEGVVGELLRRRGLTLAVGESCTGGLITDRLTDIPGSSAYLRLGVVAYSNDAKTALLGVPPELLARHGGVSPQVAAAMAAGARRAGGADLGLGVTGIAGPSGGTAEKPVGLVYLALTDGVEERVEEVRFGAAPGRRAIKVLTSQAALNLLRLHLLRASRVPG